MCAIARTASDIFGSCVSDERSHNGPSSWYGTRCRPMEQYWIHETFFRGLYAVQAKQPRLGGHFERRELTISVSAAFRFLNRRSLLSSNPVFLRTHLRNFLVSPRSSAGMCSHYPPRRPICASLSRGRHRAGGHRLATLPRGQSACRGTSFTEWPDSAARWAAAAIAFRPFSHKTALPMLARFLGRGVNRCW